MVLHTRRLGCDVRTPIHPGPGEQCEFRSHQLISTQSNGLIKKVVWFSDRQLKFLFAKMLVLCFHGLENIFVRFCPSITDQLNSILGLAKCYMLLGVPGHRLSYSPILPSSVPFAEIPGKADQGKTPKLRKKRQPKTGSKKNNTSFKEEGSRQEDADADSSYHIHSKVWKLHAASSSDSEMSDSEGQNMKQLKENQAKVRASALKMLTAAFKVYFLLYFLNFPRIGVAMSIFSL